MKRLTHKRSNGIKDGYWSPNKKDELVARLAQYENTGLDPEEIIQNRAEPKNIPDLLTIGDWTICDCHHQIRSLIRDLEEELDPEYPGYQKIYSDLQDIYEIAGKALDMGKSMEDRLTEYYEGICSLGFERKKNERM